MKRFGASEAALREVAPDLGLHLRDLRGCVSVITPTSRFVSRAFCIEVLRADVRALAVDDGLGVTVRALQRVEGARLPSSALPMTQTCAFVSLTSPSMTTWTPSPAPAAR